MARAEDHDRHGGRRRRDPVRVLVPPQGARGVIVYLHGGGWVIGTIDEFDTLARKLAERTSCAVVLVDYRLAPEHRYPTAVDDCYAALEWTAAHLGRHRRPRRRAADRRRRQRRREPRRRDGPAGPRPRRPGDRPAGADLPGHRRRLRPAVLRRPRQPAAADPRGDGLVLGPLRARRRRRAPSPTPRRCAPRSSPACRRRSC